MLMSVQALLPGCDHVAADIPGLRLDHEAAPGVGVAGLEVVDDGSEQWRVVRLSVDSLVLAQLAHCALRIQRRCWKGVWNNLVRGNRACAAEQSLQIASLGIGEHVPRTDRILCEVASSRGNSSSNSVYLSCCS